MGCACKAGIGAQSLLRELVSAALAAPCRGREGGSILRFEVEGRLAGLLPVIRAPRYYRYPLPQLASWVHDNCFLGAPLVERGCEVAFWRALLAWADRRAGTSLFLHLRSLPLSGPLHDALETVLTEQGRPGAVVHREARALLASDLSPEAYLEASLTGKKRKELRRQSARLSELGHVAVERQEDGEGIAAWCEEFLALEAKGWKGEAGSALASAPGTRALFVESLAGAAGQGRLERLTLRLNGGPIAMLASFLTSPGAFSYKTAFDESFARYSPGVLLQRENLAMLERPGIDWTDSCASADHPMIDHLWRERRVVGRYSIAIGGALRRALFTRLLRAETARAAPVLPPSEDLPA
ncbi:GNAT family N-acetyltransferase [Novosphingobium sp. 9]|uniref:GNAT family N-acetyltransferase n=1 Tax=Novosphingobium sp. 9 TaxID=2025349 RepID=UPI0021B55934|nr:GNAT family N-acetyltransferase [Novosphingobium sp. 9]